MSFLKNDIGSTHGRTTEKLFEVDKLPVHITSTSYLATHLINTRLGAEIEQTQASKK